MDNFSATHLLSDANFVLEVTAKNMAGWKKKVGAVKSEGSF